MEWIKVICCFMTLLFLPIHASTATPCPIGFTAGRKSSGCFYVSKVAMTFTGARHFCASHPGASLAQIYKEEELQELAMLLREKNLMREDDGALVWFARVNPKNAGNVTSIATRFDREVLSDGPEALVNEAINVDQLPFICKTKNFKPVEITARSKCGGSEILARRLPRPCYFMIKKMLKFDEATSECEQAKARIAEPRNEISNRRMMRYLQKNLNNEQNSMRMMIGAVRAKKSSCWKWVSDSKCFHQLSINGTNIYRDDVYNNFQTNPIPSATRLLIDREGQWEPFSTSSVYLNRGVLCEIVNGYEYYGDVIQ